MTKWRSSKGRLNDAVSSRAASSDRKCPKCGYRTPSPTCIYCGVATK